LLLKLRRGVEPGYRGKAGRGAGLQRKKPGVEPGYRGRSRATEEKRKSGAWSRATEETTEEKRKIIIIPT
jgi:hypothetical protein